MSVRLHICDCGNCNDDVIKEYVIGNVERIDENSLVEVFINNVHYSNGEVFHRGFKTGVIVNEFKDAGFTVGGCVSEKFATIWYTVLDVLSKIKYNKKYCVPAKYKGVYSVQIVPEFVEDYTRVNQGCKECKRAKWWTGEHLQDVLEKVTKEYNFPAYTVTFPKAGMIEYMDDGTPFAELLNFY